MRLINCKTMELEEHNGACLPAYGILSHTWGLGEVLFEDFSSRNLNNKKEAAKVHQTCRLAQQHNLDYAWIDTCCIDKSSSAELTEAINSMFMWYARSKRCFIYLNDLDSKDAKSDLSRCRWFSRGWTLQELIASTDAYFYDKRWRYVGSKQELSAILATITGIERPIMNGTYPLSRVSVAKKISWAAHREATREEDLAYCLIGIFGISMSLVYGEGKRAFTRLQEEIMKETNDLTLFAWQADPTTVEQRPYRGILATSPNEFGGAGAIVSSSNTKNNPEFAMTNKGLRIETSFGRGHGKSIILPLNCHQNSLEHNAIGLSLINGWQLSLTGYIS
ncbi:heterokaryon incompatibility protein-domain-containing protein [Paraphoma chrysanthemicola]|uniref:Heterokaryon incompatibility protein-domain-containing protein n=1 Tax=Paraphoma chrysanthemicola TaxID=798071 RepID=A0A8K0RDP7_9PLEO|nr:heterokaryon incompatibility protein-domain-containing protein [Paraphoma chrysanthemicola]